MFLGKGSYGKVVQKDNCAVKKFHKLSHLIQEYSALKYLSDCKHIVKAIKADFTALELYMDLYDCSLRGWLEEKHKHNSLTREESLETLRQILLGLIELHDRDLAHGDIKPGNILVKNNPFKIVLGDCGFVSNYKYAKVERTAPVYRDPNVNHDLSHDMYSFGICMLEILGNIRIHHQSNYRELIDAINEYIDGNNYRNIILNLVHPDYDKRYTARQVLNILYNQNPPVWEKNGIYNISNNHSLVPVIRDIFKSITQKYKLNRGKKGYGALMYYLQGNNIKSEDVNLYIDATIAIIYALFGKKNNRKVDLVVKYQEKHSSYQCNKALRKLLSNNEYLAILFSP